MSYLYGDSTPSKLEINYIDFLRDAVEFCVQVMLADQRITQGKAHARTLEIATAAEFERLQKLGGIVTKAFEGTPLGAADSATARCAAAIVRSATELVRQEAVAMRTALDGEIAKRDAQSTQERDGIAKALEALLVKHALPESVMDVHMSITGGTRYAGRARMKTGFGLDAVMDLDVPAGNLFERVVRVDRLMERLDVLAPEVGGWLHKEVKRKPQHLEKHHVLEFSHGSNGGTLKLRVGPDGSGAGFDIKIAREKEGARVTLARAEQQEGAGEAAFEDVDPDDAKKLFALYAKLTAATGDVLAQRRRLVDARLENEPVRTHARPTLLAERLITAMAPVVQEISARSQSPGELVLRRAIGGDRREEIFLSKAELKLKLEPLVEGNRVLFEPLWASTPPSAPKPMVVSDMPTPIAAPSHGQSIRYRPGTPSLGTPPLNESGAPGASSVAAAVAATVRANGEAAPSVSTANGGDIRRTLIGTTVQSAVQSAVQTAASAAGTVTPPAGVPKMPAAASDSAGEKAPAADSPRTETPAPLRRETAPRMEVVRGDAAPRPDAGAGKTDGPPRSEVAGTIDSKAAKPADPATKN